MMTVMAATREMDIVSPVCGKERSGSLHRKPLRLLGTAPTSKRMHTAATGDKRR